MGHILHVCSSHNLNVIMAYRWLCSKLLHQFFTNNEKSILSMDHEYAYAIPVMHQKMTEINNSMTTR